MKGRGVHPLVDIKQSGGCDDNNDDNDDVFSMGTKYLLPLSGWKLGQSVEGEEMLSGQGDIRCDDFGSAFSNIIGRAQMELKRALRS